MKTKWNVEPTDKTTLLRLISELEGACYILDCLDDAEGEYAYLRSMINKYYKLYYKK